MGVKSLTSYLEKRSRQYFENYQLHDCSLIIDGSNLCFNLYNWNYSFWKAGYSYDCYGGDYDKFANIVKGFFKMLHTCHIEPYVIFGGRNGIDRVPMIKQRLEEKVRTAMEVTPDAIRNIMSFKGTGFVPNYSKATSAAIKYVFRDVIDELNLKTFTCEEDPNREIACLAKTLKCPVLSGNSDFFILGSDFIPFSSLDYHIQVNKSQRKVLYLACKIYKIEHLLHVLNKQPHINFIPYIVPVLVGSEYIDAEILEPFFAKFRIRGSRQQKIDSIFDWIRRHGTLENAIEAILDSFDNEKDRKSASEQINHTIMAYSPVSVTSLMDHFDIKAQNNPPNFKLQGTEIEKETTGSELFVKRHRENRYPSFFIDMLKEDRYFLQCNIDDCTKPDSNSIGYTIMAAIHNILVQNYGKQLKVFRRNHELTLEEYVLPVLEDQLPSIEEIDYLRVESRLDILLNILEIDESLCQIFEALPKEWHLFVVSLKYTMSKSKIDSSVVYSLVLCLIILNFVDSNLKGFYRTIKDIENIQSEDQNKNDSTSSWETDFPKISVEDSVTVMQKFIRYFEMDEQDNYRTYDRGIMHSIGEFQCVFLHLKYLNNLLDFPIPDNFIHKIFDNTFIYNMTKKLRNLSRTEILNEFLNECPTFDSGFIYVLELLERHSIL